MLQLWARRARLLNSIRMERRARITYLMSILEGTRLGRYEVRKPIGAGGMGEVYLAQDVRLERTVALKILPAEVSADPQRMRRFEQEARAASALNHPNVAHIYEIEEVDGYHFIAMEYIEGETLRQRMTGELLNLHEALDIAQQIAAAISAAHAAGIVHRDIKPENVIVRRDGYVKVLDFGLAKLTERHDVMDTEAPTKALVNTGPGTVMGTARYMSPEQARGSTVDVRTDIWSLGVVLYEMAAGRPPFEGATPSDVISAILSKEPPPVARYARETPEALEWIVTKALMKDRDERYQTAKEMLVDLRRVKSRLEVEAEIERSQAPDAVHLSASTRSGSASVPPVVAAHDTASQTAQVSAARTTSSAEYIASGIRRHKTGLTIAIVILLLGVAPIALALLGVALYTFTNRLPPGERSTSASQTGPPQNMKISRLTSNGKTRRSSISPDGKYAVYVMESGGRQSIWIRQVSTSSNVQIVPAIEDTYYGDPSFARDGEYVYYQVYDKATPQGTLYQLPVLGGTPRKILTDILTSVSLSPDGKQFAFIRDNTAATGEDQLIVANADGSGERILTVRKGDTFFAYGGPSWSPDGRTIASGVGSYKGGIHLTLAAVNVETGAQTEFTPQKWGSMGRVAWLADGSGLVLTAGEQGASINQVWQISYPLGEARKITNDLNSYDDVSLTADSNTLVVTQGETLSNIWLMPGFDASQAKQITTGKDFGIGGLDWTPNGKIVYASAAGGNSDIWITDADGTNQKQLTNDPKGDGSPSVSPDGRFIIFVSERMGMPSLWRMDADGGSQRALTSGQEDYFPHVSTDGRWIFFSSWRSGKQAVWKISADGGEPMQLTDKYTFRPVVSPDGKTVACINLDERPGAPAKFALLSVEGGEFTRTFDAPVSANLTTLRWSPDGRSFLYIDTRNGVSNLWSQPVDGGPPKQLTDFKTDLLFRFSLAPDGKQLALARGVYVSDIVIISNFK